jgi:hydrogenase maturation protease
LSEPLRIVILGWGNPSRGDDGLGPALMRKVEAWREQHSQAGNIDLVEDFQLQIEHALDLDGRDMALFIDASASCSAPFTFTRLAPDRDSSFTTHELSPESVLHVYRQVHSSSPPPSFLLSIRGESFELGQSIAGLAAAHLEAAWAFLASLLHHIDPEAWEDRLTVR